MVATTLTVVSCLHRHASLIRCAKSKPFSPPHPADFRQDTPLYDAINERQRNYLPRQAAFRSRSSDARRSGQPRPLSPPSSTSCVRAGHIGRPPASLVNCRASSRIVAVGSCPPKSATSCARPSTLTRMLRASGPVNSKWTREPSGALASLPTTKPMVPAISSRDSCGAAPARSSSDDGRSNATRMSCSCIQQSNARRA